MTTTTLGVAAAVFLCKFLPAHALLLARLTIGLCSAKSNYIAPSHPPNYCHLSWQGKFRIIPLAELFLAEMKTYTYHELFTFNPTLELPLVTCLSATVILATLVLLFSDILPLLLSKLPSAQISQSFSVLDHASKSF